MPCMLAAYIEDGRLLRALSRVLELPAVACTTAFAYLHRIRLLQHDVQLTGQELVTACIYVAAKVEEVQLSANQLINSARILGHPAQQHLLQSLAPLPAHLVSQQQHQQEQQLPRQVSAPGQRQQVPQQHQEDEEDSSQVANLKPVEAAAADHHHPQQQQQHQRGHLHPQQHQPVATQPNPVERKLSKRQEDQQQAYPTPPQQQEDAAPTLSHPNPAGVAAASNSNHSQLQELQIAPPSSAVVVGDEYYQAKDALFTAEQIVLRLINFKLEAPQPHKHLLNFCKLLCVSRVVAAAAVCLLNDVIAYTSLCVTTHPAELAAAVLECCCECLCRTAGSTSHQQQQEEEEEQLQQPAQPVDYLPSSPPDAVHGMHPFTDKQHRKANADDLAIGYPANSKSHQHPQPVRDVQLEPAPQWSHHHKPNIHDHQPRDSVSLQQQQQQGQDSSPGSTGRGQAQHDREPYGLQSWQQPQRHHGRSSRRVNSAMPAAVLDGSWVELVGLDRGQVAELSQQLRRLFL